MAHSWAIFYAVVLETNNKQNRINNKIETISNSWDVAMGNIYFVLFDVCLQQRHLS